MDFEELKAEAKKLGYKLIKDNPPPKKLPCVCGCKRVERWYGHSGLQFRCEKCGARSPFGETERQVIRLWNTMVETNTKYSSV